MNKPSRTDEPLEGDGYNQSPNPLSNDLTTNADLNGIANSRELGQEDSQSRQNTFPSAQDNGTRNSTAENGHDKSTHWLARWSSDRRQPLEGISQDLATARPNSHSPSPQSDADDRISFQRLKKAGLTFFSFVGPGFMIAVAYIDPGNYSTDIAAGASYRFHLLFIVFVANLFAIFLQSLAIKLGTVSGLNLAEACRAFLPRWLNYILYAFAEAAIIATDIAEACGTKLLHAFRVIGFAIALNLLIPQIPLVAGCAISILDVMVILLFYRPAGSMKALRVFESFVICLVLGVVVCFCIQMSLIRDATSGEVFKGYLPSKFIIEKQAIYQACGIIGATVMPHGLYLGSGIVQPRLREYDEQRSLLPPELASGSSSTQDGIDKGYYVPSLGAIQHSLKVSIAELAISLFTFALFVNSAILIAAGASLYNSPDALDADIFGLHDLLSQSISPAAGSIFALALLLSGISAGVVCTITGQMVSEGALNWKLPPWLRRLVTRSISITPSIIIAGAVGRPGLNAALNGSQVALSIVLPIITAPLIYFTSRNKYMTAQPGGAHFLAADENGSFICTKHPVPAVHGTVKMANAWYTTTFAILVWLIITVMNVANLVLLGKGE